MLPHLVVLQAYDISTAAKPGENIPDSELVLGVLGGEVIVPDGTDPAALERVPEWALAIVQAAFELQGV